LRPVAWASLFAQLAEEYIDDLELRRVHSAIEAVKSISFERMVPLRRLRSSRMAYSEPVRGRADDR
jgi:hypothetical protein